MISICWGGKEGIEVCRRGSHSGSDMLGWLPARQDFPGKKSLQEDPHHLGAITALIRALETIPGISEEGGNAVQGWETHIITPRISERLRLKNNVPCPQPRDLAPHDLPLLGFIQQGCGTPSNVLSPVAVRA